MENQDAIVKKEEQRKALQATIELSLEVENAFKMYSYRIIDTEAYLDRVSEIVESYKERV